MAAHHPVRASNPVDGCKKQHTSRPSLRLQGQDVFGRYMRDVLEAERIRPVEPVASSQLPPDLDQTLLCFVLVDPAGRHAFCRCVQGHLPCGVAERGLAAAGQKASSRPGERPRCTRQQQRASLPPPSGSPWLPCVHTLAAPCSRYDFGPWPLLSFVEEMPEGVGRMLRATEALFVNGFTFDELPAAAVLGAARVAQEAGAAVFFDPGARLLAAAAVADTDGSARRPFDALHAYPGSSSDNQRQTTEIELPPHPYTLLLL